MRAGLSTIQQTLTPDAAAVLNHSIAEAGRRNHGQTTPLHVAATLLSSPSGYLRQACIRSHPNSSHPLQCRALELCFSVALERLPTAQNMPTGAEPPVSNALTAALKRAQAHQRRGCPEQQQQPLLAVKVELEQLIISILDDPSVSRVMREASFSSPAVKVTIEKSLNSTNSQQRIHSNNVNLGPYIGIGSRIVPNQVPGLLNRSMYLNPRLQQGGAGQLGNQRGEEVKKVLEILTRTKKRNAVLVGEWEPVFVAEELLRRIENGELGDEFPKNVQVIRIGNELILNKNQLPAKIKEFGEVIESRMGSGGVILDLGDLQWLVEQPVVAAEAGRATVVEMRKLLEKFSEGKIWLIGTATCETYLRCQVYHSTMENDWDLQAVPIASRSPLQPMFPRLENERISSNPVEPSNLLKSYSTATTVLPENSDPVRRKCCPQCLEKCKAEIAKLIAVLVDSSSGDKSETAVSSLPQWLQNAKVHNNKESQIKDRELLLKQKSQELQRQWSDTCLRLHPTFHRNVGSERIASPPFPANWLYNPELPLCQPVKSQTTRNLGEMLKLGVNQPADQVASTPASPVRTELVLGRKQTEMTPEKTNKDSIKDYFECISSEPQSKLVDKFASVLDAGTFKRILKGLMEKAWWQQEAASTVASAVTRCWLGNGKRRGGGSRGDMWLLFAGPDIVGKRKMASVLSEQMFGSTPVMISVASTRRENEHEITFRGRTVIDRISDAVKRNPFSVIMLEDIDEADILVRSNIKCAIERGRLVDSHGREISLGNIVFIMTGNWSAFNPKSLENEVLVDKRNRQLRLVVSKKRSKRRASWSSSDEDRPSKPRKETESAPSFDLNQLAAMDDDRNDGSHNTSDLTTDHEEEHLESSRFSVASVSQELVGSVDEAIVFKPVDLRFIRQEVKRTMTKKFMIVVNDMVGIEVENDVLDTIVGGLWLGRASLEEWIENVVSPCFEELVPRLDGSGESTVVTVRLGPDTGSNGRTDGGWLPSEIKIMTDGVV